MTEEEFAVCRELHRVVSFLRVTASDRKKRLLACACFRVFWTVLVTRGAKLRDWYRQLDLWVPAAVTASESFADGLIGKQELRAARKGGSGGPFNICWNVCRTDKDAALLVPWGFGAIISEEQLDLPVDDATRQLIHDIFGNPFRPSTIDPAWLTWRDGTAVKLAQTIYDDRRYDLLPILADALHEAGCCDEAILDHCRGPGPHVRGCWVVDLMLGKT